MSSLLLYGICIKTSGARQTGETIENYCLAIGTSLVTDSPKSPILTKCYIYPLGPIQFCIITFSGFKSACITLFLCIQLTPFNICFSINFLSIYYSLMILLRSVWQRSRTKQQAHLPGFSSDYNVSKLIVLLVMSTPCNLITL